ncbi:MAG: DNA-J related domain-containing protein [Cellvibrionaceae bacterium]
MDSTDKIFSGQHFIEAIRCIIEVSIEPISEYQLIQRLNEQGWTLSTNAADSLSLFNSHFVVFNALYQLQTEYWEERRYLEISALAIQLHAVLSQASPDSTEAERFGTESQALSASYMSTSYSDDQSLRDYYLDMSNLENATEESVNDLLSQFWQRFMDNDDSSTAFAVFSLQPPVTYTEVKQRYRSLAMEHHPDRGGNEADFQQVNWAFGVLQRICR